MLQQSDPNSLGLLYLVVRMLHRFPRSVSPLPAPLPDDYGGQDDAGDDDNDDVDDEDSDGDGDGNGDDDDDYGDDG